MNLTDALAAGRKRKGKRKGRGPGSGKGGRSGRGNKGFGQHASKGLNPLYEGGQMPLARRLPKRGFKGPPAPRRFEVVNVSSLGRFAADSRVGPAELAAAGLVRGRKSAGLGVGVKILGSGELAVKLTVSVHAVSAAAQAKIEAAGGAVELIGGSQLPVTSDQ